MKDDVRKINEAYRDSIPTKPEPKHWSTRVDDIRSEQRDAEIERVTCHCDDCIHWSAGNKCVAHEITLSRKKDIDLGMVCICETYESGGS